MKKNNSRCIAAPGLRLAIMLVLAVVATRPTLAQTYTIIHNFTGGGDGSGPTAHVTIDTSGQVFGTAEMGALGHGMVFKLKHSGSGWTFLPLYAFSGGSDGGDPWAGVTISSDGTLYGTTYHGGTGNGGTIFHLTPPATVCKAFLCPWTETVLHRFTGGDDGFSPLSSVTFDSAGNLYGTTAFGGGSLDVGVVYELARSGGTWTESILHSFTIGDGALPSGAVIFDGAGNLYSTTQEGGTLEGTVFELVHSGSGWTISTLYNFTGGADGQLAAGGVIFDQAGNLYGGAADGGSGGGGTVYKLTPSTGSWTLSTLCSFSHLGGGADGTYDSLVMDAAGNLYGTTVYDGAYGAGSVFKATPSGGGWLCESLHDFCAGGYPCTDGEVPFGGVTLDTNGNIYGTASAGGTFGKGVVFEITPN